MKKLTLLIICTLIFGAAQAQERVLNRGVINHNEETGGPDRFNSGFGIKGGVLFNSLHGDGEDMIAGLKSSTNWHAGFYAQFSVSRAFSIQPEALYTRRKVESDNGSLRFDYFDVPVLAVFNITDNISIHGGPQVGIMMTAKRNDEEINKEGMNTLDYGGAVGLEAKVFIFRLGGRYYRSFSDIGNGNFDASTINASLDDVKAGNFQVYLGVGF